MKVKGTDGRKEGGVADKKIDKKEKKGKKKGKKKDPAALLTSASASGSSRGLRPRPPLPGGVKVVPYSREFLAGSSSVQPTQNGKGPTKTKKKGKKKPLSKSPNKGPELQIVPWVNWEEWHEVCKAIHEERFEFAVREMSIWEQRVPSVPLAVESTLLILQAAIYDKCRPPDYNPNLAKALFGMALARHLNHAGHMAATSLGENTTMPTKELTAVVGTPDWMVSLRNDVIHATCLPSLELLRMSGVFALEWLKECYWKLSPVESRSDECNSDPLTDSEALGELLYSFLASRIYKLRGIQTIDDEEVTKHLRDRPRKAKTAAVIKELKSKISFHIRENPEIMCSIVSSSLVPSPEFYSDFQTSLVNSETSDPFDFYVLAWSPLLKILLQMNLLPEVLVQLGESFVETEDRSSQELAANWIKKIMQLLEEGSKDSPKHLMQLLSTVINSPKRAAKVFFPELLDKLEWKLGADAKTKLQSLGSIWMDDTDSLGTDARGKVGDNSQLFTVEHILSDMSTKSDFPLLKTEDAEYWRKIPFGTIF